MCEMHAMHSVSFMSMNSFHQAKPPAILWLKGRASNANLGAVCA